MEDEVDEDGGRQADDGQAQHDVVEPEPARRWLCALACFHLGKKKTSIIRLQFGDDILLDSINSDKS